MNTESSLSEIFHCDDLFCASEQFEAGSHCYGSDIALAGIIAALIGGHRG
jgi:hypothetical protein